MWIDEAGQTWYKGNLHTHTTRSDGQYSPEEAIALYRENGYDFLALTDHWKRSDNGMDPSGLLLMSGCEYNFGADVREGIYHIVGIGMQRDPLICRADDAQAAIDRIHAAGGIAVLAHPAWSLNTPEQIRALHGIDATEIFNSVSDLPRNCRPYSGAIVDLMASAGCFYPLIATDDTHFYQKADACRSYIMVHTQEFTPVSILDAIRAGDFYATQGPRLNVTRKGDRICVRCSPVSSVIFFSDSVWSGKRVISGENVTEAEYTFLPSDTYVRVEVCDAAGNYAWSSCFSADVQSGKLR